jgi:hypothetical protein
LNRATVRATTPISGLQLDQLARTLALAVVGVVLAAGLLAGLYLVKAALGINVFSGHVPLLHTTLYPLVRG